MKLTIFGFGIFIIFFFLGFISTSFATSCVDAKKLIKVNVCVDNADWDPYIDTQNKKGQERKKIEGFYTYIANAALRCAGYEPVLKLYPWKRCAIGARSGKIDAIYVASYKKERTAYFDYPKGAENIEVPHPQSVGIIGYSLVCHKGVTWQYDGNLKGKKIGGLLGATVNDKVKEQGGSIEPVRDNSLNLKKTLKNNPRIDCFVSIETLADQFVNSEEHEGRLWKQKRHVQAKDYFLVFSKKGKKIPPAKRQIAWDYIARTRPVVDQTIFYLETQK